MNESTKVAAPGTVLIRIFRALAATGVLAALLVPAIAAAQEAGEPASTPVYFEETGQVLTGAFLDAWFDAGGPEITGFPVSPPVKLANRWVQWFEYARLEVVADSYTQASSEDVIAVDIGKVYADGMGYAQSMPAFKRIGSASEAASYFEETGHSVANGFLDTYLEGSNADRLGAPISEEFSLNATTYQFFKRGALSWNDATGTVFVPIGTLDAMLRGTLGNRADRPDRAEVYSPGTFALRSQYPGERWIEVNLSTYTLTAWEGNAPVLSTLVVTGAPISPTVSGEFRVYWKLDSQTMSGVGVDGIAYDQPDVPDVMYFFQDWAIHGAYWRSTFGYGGSHGCVNVPLQQAAWLYDWASVGTRVVVHA